MNLTLMNIALLEESNDKVEQYHTKFKELKDSDPQKAQEYLQKARAELKRADKLISKWKN